MARPGRVARRRGGLAGRFPGFELLLISLVRGGVIRECSVPIVEDAFQGWVGFHGGTAGPGFGGGAAPGRFDESYRDTPLLVNFAREKIADRRGVLHCLRTAELPASFDIFGG